MLYNQLAENEIVTEGKAAFYDKKGSVISNSYNAAIEPEDEDEEDEDEADEEEDDLDNDEESDKDDDDE